MKTRVLTQGQKQHNTNALHDALIAADLTPLRVESSASESRFVFNDEVTDQAITDAIASYTFAAAPVDVDIHAAWLAYRNAVNNATTIGQIKSALTDELGTLLKELFRSRVGPL